MKILAVAIITLSLICNSKIPRVNCVKRETSEPEPEPETTESDAPDVYSYKVDIIKHLLLVPPNDIFHIEDRNDDEPAEYHQTMTANSSLNIYRADIKINENWAYETKGDGKMTTLCEDSYPEKSVEANIWKIMNLALMDGQSCPIPKGYKFVVPRRLPSTFLTFDKPIPCGDYVLHMDFDTSEGEWIIGVYFDWTIEKGSTECTDEVNPL
ncbi:uncharacterized protein LOC130663938 [Microplitis mediator]|uniref:uncharacterized protein LOC130663938 n=1 Tax=Microplitis mediator TaxID=375433 RepID=UPI002554E1A8|nr:uncharacterized protein LOC130663938 [Microplitis mediator]